MDLLTPQEKAEAEADIKNLFDTFARTLPVRFYKMPKETVTMDINYSNDYDQGNKNLKTPQYQDFKCRVWFLERQGYENLVLGNDEQIRGEFLYNRIKLHMELDAFEYLKKTTRFIFDGIQYQLNGSWRGLGLFGDINYYEIILQRVN